MAGPAPTSYEPEFQKFASPANSNSPLSPNSRGGTPISLKANVNRAKTRRWVEARQYSYDGNDWGDEDDEEYDDEPPPVPQPPPRFVDTKGLPRPSFPVMDRSKSMDQVLTVHSDGASGNRSRSAEGEKAAIPGQGAQTSSKPAPFVRPADIYKRMREEREKESPPVATRANTDPISRETSGLDNERGRSTTTAQDVPILGLPNVKRLSGNLKNSESNAQQPQSESQQHQRQLQHNPSLGFRSAVNQAFDVPETPSSAVDTVERSNSASTSAISPIMPNRGMNDEKTPTIVEEPGEVTPKDGSDRNIVFKPGHRRDLSLPSPGNSPSRKPKIMDNEQVPSSAIAQVSSTTPSGSHEEQALPSLQQPKRASVQLPNVPAKDLPPPLRVTSNPSSVAAEPPTIPPVIIPSSSTDNSPQDTESDRLRKEIIRSLSRENTPSDGPESRPETRRDNAVPSEYENYWNQESARSPQDEQPNPEHNPSNTPQGITLEDVPVGPAPAPWQDSQPKLKKKFSWESSSSEELGPPVDYSLPLQDPPVPGQLPPDETAPPSSGSEEPARQSVEKPKLTIIPPSAGDESSLASGWHLPEVVPPQSTEPAAENTSTRLTFNAQAFIPQTVLGFRDIMGIKSSDERSKAFERTRAQFGAIDTGLSYWIQMTLQAHPEHEDIVGQNLKLAVGAPKKSKFPKLPSIGNFSSHPQAENAPPGQGHVRRPSAPLGSIKMDRGKDLLHTAGALGGRAGEAARGFFARGRNKFKSGNEKGSQSIRAKFRSLPTLRLAGTGSGEKSRSPQRRHSTFMGAGGLSWGRRSSWDEGVWLSTSRQLDTTATDKGKSVQRPQSSPPGMSHVHVQWSTAEGPKCPEHGHHPVTTKCTECQGHSTTVHGYDYTATSSQQRDLNHNQKDGFLNIPTALHRGNSSVSSLGTQEIRQDTAIASRISLPDEAEAGHVQHSGGEESATFSLVADPSGPNTRSHHKAVNSSADVDETEAKDDTDRDMAWKDRYRNVLNRISGLLKPKDKIPRYPTTTDTNTHTTNLNPSKSKPNTKSQNMPPKKPLPYHPNDYWDRTHFSTDHDHDHDRAHSPTHSISSLPTHPPNLGIPSSSAAGRSKRDEIPRPRGRGAERTYAQELQLRSRSPRVWKVAGTDGGRSASASGSFGISHKANTNTDPNSKRRISQGVSESSKSPVPNNPNDSEDNHNHTTVNENENTRPRTIRTVNETQPVELLGTKHDGHDEEEVVMSSTAYPGQEWRPAGLARWEDC